MANTQININESGTVTLATAGKYCDRNVDVVVDVDMQLIVAVLDFLCKLICTLVVVHKLACVIAYAHIERLLASQVVH